MEGTSFAEDRAAVAAGAVTLRRLLGRLHQAGSGELGPLFTELDALKTLAEAAQVGVLDQGLSAVTFGPRMRRRRRGGSASGAPPTGPVARPPWCGSRRGWPSLTTSYCVRRYSVRGPRSATPRSP